jgi:hypothetical protein
MELDVDYDASTVTFGGRRFPAVCVICPPIEGQPDSEWDRMLGGRGSPTVGRAKGVVHHQVMIPCENGILVAVEAVNDREGFSVHLYSRASQLTSSNDILWLPYTVSLLDGGLAASWAGVWWWRDAEPEWTVELIDRVSRMPFTQPPGPQVRLITLAETRAIEAAHRNDAGTAAL